MNPSMGLGGGCPAADTPSEKGTEQRLLLLLTRCAAGAGGAEALNEVRPRRADHP